MKAWLKRIQAWDLRRQQRSLEWWEQERVKGKAWFVFRTALTCGLMMAGTRDVYEHVFYDGTQYFSLLFHTIFYSLTGIVVGLAGWSGWESKYHKALHEARLKALPSGNALPDQ